MDPIAINHNFKYHQPKPGQAEQYQNLRDTARELAHMINTLVPDGREQALALTNLEQSIFWANAGIARHGA